MVATGEWNPSLILHSAIGTLIVGLFFYGLIVGRDAVRSGRDKASSFMGMPTNLTIYREVLRRNKQGDLVARVAISTYCLCLFLVALLLWGPWSK